MLKHLRKLFPQSKPQMRVVLEDCPEWDSSHAEHLALFLSSGSGQCLLKRLRFEICATLLNPNLAEENRNLARAMTLLLEGLESNADVASWAEAERRPLDENEQAYRYFQVDVDDVE